MNGLLSIAKIYLIPDLSELADSRQSDSYEAFDLEIVHYSWFFPFTVADKDVHITLSFASKDFCLTCFFFSDLV